MSKRRVESEDEKITRAMAERPKRVIAVDLDSTLARDSGWKGFRYIGKPIPHIAEQIRREHRAGAHVILYTCRATTADNRVNLKSLATVDKWMRRHRIPYDDIWTGTGKVFAHIYLDDRAVNPCCSGCMKRAFPNEDALGTWDDLG